jgi:transcription antitermination protein NusB
VVMNEAIELTKRFGGTDAHKYVNGVLDRLVPELRVAEWTEALKLKNAV